MSENTVPEKSEERKNFEQWYATHAFWYERDPIGSRDCSLQWDAWQAALAQKQEKAASQEAGEVPAKCPECGGSLTTWKCQCNPIWPGYAKSGLDLPWLAERLETLYKEWSEMIGGGIKSEYVGSIGVAAQVVREHIALLAYEPKGGVLGERITAYLSGGGLFNPEFADHRGVRDLLVECRDVLAAKPPKAVAEAVTEMAWRAGWRRCRDAEFVGVEAEDAEWGFDAPNVIARAERYAVKDQGELDVFARLLRDCLGSLEVSAALIESDDTEQIEGLITAIKIALGHYDHQRAHPPQEKAAAPGRWVTDPHDMEQGQMFVACAKCSSPAECRKRGCADAVLASQPAAPDGAGVEPCPAFEQVGWIDAGHMRPLSNATYARLDEFNRGHYPYPIFVAPHRLQAAPPAVRDMPQGANFRALLVEAYEMADNWPGIAYTHDLCARIDAALAQPVPQEKAEGVPLTDEQVMEFGALCVMNRRRNLTPREALAEYRAENNLPAGVRDQGREAGKLWLWRNGDHFWAFDNLYPCFTPGGDPMTLGEPVGYAIFKPSHGRDFREEY